MRIKRCRLNQKRTYLTKSAAATRKLGENLARAVFQQGDNKTFILALIGDLGGGKTTFLQGFARGLGIKEKVFSPTFILIRKTGIPRKIAIKGAGRRNQTPNPGFRHFFHVDCYRADNAEEIAKIGLKAILERSGNIVAIEWADKVKEFLPGKTLYLEFDFIDKNKRMIKQIRFKNDRKNIKQKVSKRYGKRK